jgi:D-glycero-alpha-D-manno-heptose-7-phosphate kinase
MIISKTPYRISFFGGGSDYPEWYLKNGGEVISSTIDKYLYISCRELSNFFRHKYRIIYSETEEVKKIEEIKHRAVRLVLLKKKIKKNLEIHYNGDLPARSGMGSSSSFLVGLLNAINNFKNHNINKTKLAHESIFFEQKILKECVGSQDQVACTFGGFNSIKFREDNTFKIKNLDKMNIFKNNLNKNLVLLYTGKQRTAEKIAKRFVSKINTLKYNNIRNILDLVTIAKDLINKRDYNSFGLLLNEGWKIKKQLDKSISNNFLDDIYSKAINHGALGGKILGAGAGGFFLFYVPSEKKKYFLGKMNFLTHIPFQFEDSGSQIIFNSGKNN